MLRTLCEIYKITKNIYKPFYYIIQVINKIVSFS